MSRTSAEENQFTDKSVPKQVNQISREDLLEYREVSLSVDEAQAALAAANSRMNRFHQRMEGKYGYWLGQDEVDFAKGTITRNTTT